MNAERDFAAWIDRRDAAALGRVFDGTAGRLLLLAVHLAGAGGEAEDLVQATFLQAMERGGSWDRTRPLWPWLAGILHNEARMRWRRRQRRREVAEAGAQSAATNEPGPVERALRAEAVTVAIAAVDALPVPYRQVLRLRLQHGLSPIEIARALEVPVGTVRSQLHRGLEQLRGALPAGLALALATLLLGEGALLAQVRAQVLATAAATTVSAGAFTGVWSWLGLAGWMSMKGKAVVAVAVAILLIGCGWWIENRPDAAPTQPSSPGLELAHAEVVAAPADVPSQGAPASRTAMPAPAQWPFVMTVRDDAAPVAGAEVEVWVASRGGPLGLGDGEWLREDLARGVTDADGVFGCTLDALRQRSELFRASRFVFFAVRSIGRGCDSGWLPLPAAIDPHSFEASLRIGARGGIVGRVVDAAGEPVVGAEVRALREGTIHNVAEVTAADGRFIWPTPQADVWPEQIVVQDPRHGLVQVPVPPASAPRDPATVLDLGLVRLSGRDAIRGRVVLGDGLPLAEYPVVAFAIDADTGAQRQPIGACLQGRDGHGREPVELRAGVAVAGVLWSRTAADGSFSFAGLERDRPYAIAARDSGLGFVWVPAHVDEVDVELRVPRQLVRIEVRDDAGTMLAGLRLRADASADGRHQVGNAFFAAADAGDYQLLSPFGWTWTIAVADPEAAADSIEHAVVAGVHRAAIQLPVRPQRLFGTLHVTAVDEAGAPLCNYGVVLRCLDRPLEKDHSRIVPPPDGLRLELPAGRWHVEVWLGKEAIYEPLLQMYCRGRHDEDLAIAPGETIELRAVAPPAGMVAFDLRSDEPPPGGMWPDLRIVDQATGADVAVLAHREWRPDEPRLQNAFVPVCDAQLIVREALSPGRHVFVVTARGYRAERCEVDVAADALTACALRLLRQP